MFCFRHIRNNEFKTDGNFSVSELQFFNTPTTTNSSALDKSIYSRDSYCIVHLCVYL